MYSPPKMLIDGDWIDQSKEGEDVRNPATEEIIARLPHASPADLDRALAAAERGFNVWRAMSAESRADILLRACALLRDRADDIGATITIEQGKPIAEARLEVLRAATIIEWDANEGRRAYGKVIPGDDGFWRLALRRPIGPVAAFSPWNFPISSPARKLGGALAAGNSIIMKASEETPAAATALFKALHDAGLPAGVANLVFGVPSRVSEQLIASPVIRAITFTGSISVGKHLAGLAARQMKPAIMELGGHSPVIICADADASVAGAAGAAAKFRNAGQICTAPTRFLVHESVHETFVENFVAATNAIKVGNGLDKGVGMGPLANGRRLEAIQNLVADATAKGARIAAGGSRVGNLGYFMQPTVLDDVPLTADVMNTEPFGPLAPVTRFSTLEEAITIANSLPYGLCSFAFTESAATAQDLANRVESGIMSINHYGTSQADTPFGGVKESGYGREGGFETLSGYMMTKFVSHKVRA